MFEIVFPRRILYYLDVVESESWRKEFILFLMQGRTVFADLFSNRKFAKNKANDMIERTLKTKLEELAGKYPIAALTGLNHTRIYNVPYILPLFFCS